MADVDIPSKIDLGCGEDKPDGFYGVDRVDTRETDKVIDLDDSSWDLPDDYFTVIRANDVFEHLENPLTFIQEVHRIGEDGAEVIINSPHRSSQNWTDPTHKRLVGMNTFKNYCTADGKYSFYTEVEFEQDKSHIQFAKEPYYPWNFFIEPLVNVSEISKAIFENTYFSRAFPARDVTFRLTVKK